ncbi:hypothetical protein HMPREF0083_03241 [Aneurinibacillus aneurinilyticus ATCC 12856]|uniref:Uncharacterized protein n=1 Tax=Aneurinibacillus aneurinilyticus ATCC 12856 TaxID=649747 RepID=U1YCZ3_ANEAE|nr:hypothetical protein HMPREF0083_03241 [Aneurinibacillus aneurinilyticus ATCC 12856]
MLAINLTFSQEKLPAQAAFFCGVCGTSGGKDRQLLSLLKYRDVLLVRFKRQQAVVWLPCGKRTGGNAHEVLVIITNII